MKNCANIDIIVPSYKNVDMLRECISSLLNNVTEIAVNKPRLIVVNDSPDDESVSDYLSELAKAGRHACEVIVYTNDENIGFVKSVNRALKITVRDKHSALLVNADTVTFPGTLLNLIKAAYLDSQIGFACPRSNNAALATFPHFPHPMSGLNLTPKAAYGMWESLARYLPDITYAPTAVGFYLFIKDRVLFEFGSLDETFGLGYEEENDLVMRANKVGFQAILANKAFAFHYGSASFRLISESVEQNKSKNLSLMVEKNPEFIPLVRSYENSSHYFAEKLIGNLLSPDGKVDVIFDLRRLWPSHNGTTKATTMMLKTICRAGESQFRFSALCSEDAYKFHGLNKIINLHLVTSVDGMYAIAVNLGQPFDLDQINVLEKLAPLNVYGVLDVIAHDCGYLRLDNNFRLEDYWKHLSRYSDGLYYISDFSKSVFFNRFKSPHDGNFGQINSSLLMPTTPEAYLDLNNCDITQRRHILVFGNHFIHKHSVVTAKNIARRFGAAKVVCFCGEDSIDNNIQYVKSGEVEDHYMKWYLSNSSLVILPSFYEGFGIGLIEAIGFGKPVVIRRTPAVEEILSSYDDYSGIFLYDNNDELYENIINAANQKSCVNGGVTQEEWGGRFCEFLGKVLSRDGIYENLVNRLYSSRFLNEDNELRRLLTSKNELNVPANYSENSPVGSHESVDIVASFTLKMLLEVEEDREYIDGLFRLLLGRPSDEAGMNHYLSVLTKYKGDRSRILLDILSSSEMGMPDIGKIKLPSPGKGLLPAFMRR
jgi:GT2 family glycosyltransferase/glycosyltransferase involved in cell wall biosynthesis